MGVRVYMSRKTCDVLFFTMVFTLIFMNIPNLIQMGFVGGGLGSKLCFYPIIIGMIYTFYCHYKYRSVLVGFTKLRNYVAVYLGVTMLSLVVGLYTFPYYDMILSGPADQIEKLPKVLAFFNGYGIAVTQQQLLGLWMLVRPIKSLIMYVFYTLGTAYMIYCWYHDNWKRALDIVTKAVLCSIGVISVYCIIEINYLAGSQWAGKVLANINPYIHEVKTDGKWWPPLLWKGQLRSLFAEPSYFGMYSAFCLPFLWLQIIKKKHYLYIVLTVIMTFLLFLTKARTGFMLHLGELVLLLLVVLFLRPKENWKGFAIILCCSAVAFVGSNVFISNYMTPKNNFPQKIVAPKSMTKNAKPTISDSMKTYVESNAASLANPDKRSNRARYSVMEADFKIGLDHPLLGVGMGLRSAYMPDYFSKVALENGEVKMWLSFQKKLGVLRSGFPKLGEYTTRFAETGLLGLVAFLFPPIVLILSILKRLKKGYSNETIDYGMFLIAFVGMMAAAIGDSINITWCYWVLLGLGYAMCFGKDEKKEIE